MIPLVVVLGGAVGAAGRYLLSQIINSRTRSDFPWGTLAVNLLGTFVLGLVTALWRSEQLSSASYALIATGLCGAFTTFSTFSLELTTLIRTKHRRVAIGTLTAHLGGGTAAICLGWYAGNGLAGIL